MSIKNYHKYPISYLDNIYIYRRNKSYFIKLFFALHKLLTSVCIHARRFLEQ